MFETLVGNSKIKKILSETKEPSHAYMFLGISGIGKLLFAKEFAYKWLCNSDMRPCGKCKSCIQFKGSNNIDFNVIEPDGDSIKVEQIRNLIKKIYEKPVEANKKIYIINDADTMTDAAQNALLKILEEPPVYVIIILIGANEHSFLTTIKSRCIKINFQEIEKSELKKYIESQGKNVEEKFLDIYQGSIGNFKKIEGEEELYLQLEELIKNIRNVDKIQFVKKCTNIITKENFREMLEYINILLFKYSKEDVRYLKIIEHVNLAIKQREYNCNIEMILDNLFLNIYDVEFK